LNFSASPLQLSLTALATADNAVADTLFRIADDTTAGDFKM